jgi:putative peptidoglycan lipid II flippase
MTLQLWWGSRAMGEAARFDDRLRARLPRTVAASAVMGLFLWGGAQGLSEQLTTHGDRYWALAALVLGGMAVYGAAAWGFGAFRLADFRGAAPPKDQR